jgi:hypothetical protein
LAPWRENISRKDTETQRKKMNNEE